MTVEEFNKKYEKYLEEGHYGLDIGYESVVDYLDSRFEELILLPGFQFSQIKLKFNAARFYFKIAQATSWLAILIGMDIEKEINRLVNIEDEIRKRIKNGKM